MFVVVVVVIFYFATKVIAQEQSLSAATHQPPHLPFLDLFTGASNYYSEPIRKSYSDGYYHSCPKPDTLASFASLLGSAAKIMMSAAVIALFKMLGAKLLLLPITVMVLAKMGLKAILLWPVVTKIMKYLKKKQKSKARVIMDCSERLACVLQRSSDSSWGSNFGSALTFSMIDDVNEDGFVAKTLLSVLAGENVAECMSLDCNPGSDIS